MKKLKWMKRVLIVVILFSMLLPGSAVIAEEPKQTEEGLFKDGVLLCDGDEISESDTLLWKQKIVITDGETEWNLPQNLIFSKENLKLVVLTDDSGKTIPAFISSGDKKIITISGNVPEISALSLMTETKTAASVSYLLTVPCTIDMSAAADGFITINGLKLIISKVMAENRAAVQLSNYTAELHKEKSDEPGKPEKEPIAPGETINLKDNLFLIIFKDNLKDITVGQDYEIKIPKAIGSPSGAGTMDLFVQIAALPSAETKFATLSWEAGDTVLTVRFLDFGTVEGITIGMLEDIYMYFGCNLGKDSSQADDQGKITIDLPGGKTFEIIVGDWVPKGPELKKEIKGALGDDGTAEWTITYQHPTSAYKGEVPTSLVDTLPEGMEYRDTGNIAITKNGTPVSNTTGLTIDAGTGTMTYDFAAAGVTFGDKMVITYKTKLTNKAINEIWGSTKAVSYKNTVKGINALHPLDNPVCSAEGTLNIPNNWVGRDMIDKKAVVRRPAADTDPWEIDWTIKVDTASRNFVKLQVIDTMGKGLILDTTSIKIDGTAIGSTAYTYKKETLGDNKTKMTVTLVDSPGGTALPSYTITYTTEIDDEYFSQTGAGLTDDDLKNAATLYFEWPAGDVPGTPLKPPTISKGPDDLKYNNKLINKSDAKYNPADHSLTWKISVNPNKVNLTKATIIDDLSDDTLKHRFVLDTVNTETEEEEAIRTEINKKLQEDSSLAGTSLTSVDISNNKLTIVIEGLGKRTFDFTVKTYASDPAYWAGNSDFTYKNKAVMEKGNSVVGTAPTTKDSEAETSIKPTNNVLTKSNTAYDPVSKKITWELLVNKSKANLGNVTIEDVLPAGLSCDTADAKLDGAVFDGTNNTFNFDGSTNMVSIHLSNVTAEHTITFQTAVDVNTADFQTKDVITFENTAKIKSDSYDTWTDSNKSTISLDNTVLNKTAVVPDLSAGKNYANYTVTLNPQGMDLLAGMDPAAKLSLGDTLDDGLYLDLETIKMYDAKRTSVYNNSAKKWEVKVEKIEPSLSPQPPVTYDSKTNSFSIEIPDAQKCYILEYTAYVVRTGVKLTNNVQLHGSVIPGSTNQGNAQKEFTMQAFGGARFSLPRDKFLSIEIKKEDNNGGKLQGAKFGLFANKTDSTPLVEATCDKDSGICTLAIPLSALGGAKKFYWKELAAPGGYEINDEWHELDADNPPADAIVMVNVPTAQAASGEIHIRKTNGTAAPITALTGAKFELYTDSACTDKAVDETEVGNDGKLTFTGLYPTKTYWLKETAAPSGYVLLALPIAVKAETAAAVRDIPNEKANVTLEVTKVDAESNTMVVPDVEFSLYSDMECSIPVGTAQKTEINGKCSFKDLQPGTTYYLKETKEANGYIKNTNIYTIKTEENNKTIPLKIANYKIGWDERASIQITKTNIEETAKLKGAHFQLYSEDKETLFKESITDNNGICLFKDLKAGTYYIKEVKAPEGYEIINEWTEAVVSTNTAKTITITNNLIGWNAKASVQIIKTDAAGKIKLKDAEFELYKQDKTTLAAKGITDANGICTFSGLKEGTYYLKEKKAPAGYLLNKEWLEVNVRMNTAETVTVKNTPIPPEDNTEHKPGENSKDSNGIKAVNPVKEAENNYEITTDSIPKTNVKSYTVLWVIGLAISLLAAAGLCFLWIHQKEMDKDEKRKSKRK